jgi:phosphomethylpyrimidine synthase
MTLLKRARNSVTEEIRFVAEAEGVDAELVRRLLHRGELVIVQNNCQRAKPLGVGSMLRTKVNANVGTSRDAVDPGEEVEKARTAIKYGADTVMDLSTAGDLDRIRRSIMKAVDAPVGSVPLYQAACQYASVTDMSCDDMFNAVRRHCRDGIDFITVHCGVNKNSLRQLEFSGRILDVVSRGGAFTIAWMLHHDAENPFYAEFDYLLEIAAEYDVVLSLGDGMRPGCLHDASDRAKYMEFITLGELVERCRSAGVQCMVEGPGHVPLDEIETSVKAMKHLCKGAPLYLLGPLVTDLAPGYDHITAAIGGAVAGMYGADFLCMTTPAEHLALPTREDVRDGAVVAKIAAHAADLVKTGQRDVARRLDDEMARARKELNWQRQFELALDPERAREIHSRSKHADVCSMCGELCAIKVMREMLKK